MLTSLGVLEGNGVTGHNAKWNDDSEAAEERDYVMLVDIMTTVDKYDPKKLSDSELLSVKVLKEMLGNPEADKRFRL